MKMFGGMMSGIWTREIEWALWCDSISDRPDILCCSLYGTDLCYSWRNSVPPLWIAQGNRSFLLLHLFAIFHSDVG